MMRKNSDRELHGETEKRYCREPLKTPSAVKSPPSRCSEEEEGVVVKEGEEEGCG